MGRLFKRTEDGTWWGDWTDARGRRQQRSLRTRDRTVARERLRAAELAAPDADARRPQRLSEAIDYMITATCHDKAEGTRHMYQAKGRRIATTLGDPDIKDVTRDILSAYIQRRLNKEDAVHGKASPHTVHKELITIRRALTEAHERGLLEVSPAQVMPRFSPRYVPRERFLTVDQFERLIAQLHPTRQLWVSLAALAGMRLGEVERLTWAGVDLAGGWVTVPGTKTAKARRRVPLTPALRARLGEPGTGLVVERWINVRRDLEVACRKAKVPKVTANDLRRTFASWLVQAGVERLAVAHLMGHSTTRMVELVYGRLDDDSYQRAMAKMPTQPVLPCNAGVTEVVPNEAT